MNKARTALSNSDVATLINDYAVLLREEVLRIEKKWWKHPQDKERLAFLLEKQKGLAYLWAKHFIEFLT